MMRTTLILLLLTLPLMSLGHQYVGHVVIAETAYRMLDEKHQEKLQDYAKLLEKEGNLGSIYDRMRAVSSFAKAAYVPTAVRQKTPRQVYDEFGGTLPPELATLADTSTDAWHFVDYPYLADDCREAFVSDVNVEIALNAMQQAYHAATDDASRAIALVYIAHLVGDAHLPVNAMSRNIAGEPGQCQSDRGGERFCIVPREKDAACPEDKNLNHFWQNTAYQMNDVKRLRRYVREVESAVARLDATGLSMSVQDWTREGHEFAGFVYSTPEDEWPSRSYEAEAKRISIERMARAAVRLKRLIESLEA